MKNQTILAMDVQKQGLGYFSIWLYGKRIPGNFNPYNAIKSWVFKTTPYNNETLAQNDKAVVLQPLLLWNEE